MKSKRVNLAAWQQHLLSLSFGAAALIFYIFLQHWIKPQDLFWIAMPSIALASALGGMQLGLTLLLAGALSISVASPAQASPASEWHSLLPFLGQGVILVAMGSLLHRYRARSLVAEERLRLSTEGTEIGVFEIDLVKETVYASPALMVLAGIPASPQALPFSIWHQYLPPDLVHDNLRFLQMKMAEGLTSYEREVSIIRSGGESLNLSICVLMRHARGRVVRLRGTCVNVTERKAVHQRLIQVQDRLSQQLNDLSHLHELSTQLLEIPQLESQLKMILNTLAYFHGAQQGLVSLYDAHSSRLEIGASLGISAEAQALLAKSDTSACATACREQARVIIEDTTRDLHLAERQELAHMLGCRAVHCTPLTSPQGEMLGTLTILLSEPRRATPRECTLADICARKAVLFIERARTRKALQDSQGRFEAVLEASGAPFVILEPVSESQGITDFRWTYVNHAAARALGQQPRELMGCNVLGTLAGLSMTGPEFSHCIKAIETQQTCEFDTASGKGRKTRWFHCIASPIHGSVAIWFTDISERIRNEQRLRHSDLRKDEFLATLAHELRNPLAPIRQAAELLMSPQVSDAQRRWASEVIDRQVKRMALLLDDLLDVPRISRGTLKLKKTLNNINDILAAALETTRPNIDAKKHRLSVHGGQTPIVVQADALRLAQVISNLLNNAAKYTDPGGSIKVVVCHKDDDVVIEVHDDGLGIPPSALPDMFRMFTQLRHPGDRTDGGLGIGLALSKGLVELHGGSLTAHSEGSGRGSVFTVRLPLGTADQQATVPRPAIAPAPAPSSATHRCKVLIADDNRDALDTLALLLTIEGHETHRAYDGVQALAVWHEIQPDACLLDIGMPKRTGYQVAREIRSLPGGDATLLIAVTGWGQAQDRQASLDAGFDHHLTKPINPEQIAALLQAIHEQRTPPQVGSGT
ncbi:MAG: ATP-binding protein [Acidovorax sp.]